MYALQGFIPRASMLVIGLAVAACEPPPRPAPPPPKVAVAKPVEREVVEWDEYTARLEAVDFVEVRARVSGNLDVAEFQEGALVEKGALLFVIDPRPYEATLSHAEAEAALARSRLELSRKRLDRAAKLLSRNAVSQEDMDTRQAEANEADAQVRAADAAVESARLDVEFTHVKAPVSGRIGRKIVTQGNLVNGGSGTQGTLLTTIVSLDPMYATFDADEASFLRYVRLGLLGERKSLPDEKNPVHVGLSDEQGYPHEGWLDFVDNRVDPNTGTVLVRAVVPNHDLLLSPGLFVRLRLPGSEEYRAMLLPDEAIGADQSQRFVWVVDGQNHAQYRTVQTGPLEDGLRIIREGLAPDDRVVVAGLQRVRAGIEVAPDEKGADARVASAPPLDSEQTSVKQ